MDIFYLFFWGGRKKWILLFICFCCLKARPWTSRLPSFNLEIKSTWIAGMGGQDIPPESFKADRHIVHTDEEPLRGTRQLLQRGPNCDIKKKGAGEERRSQRGCCNGGGFITTGQHFLISPAWLAWFNRLCFCLSRIRKIFHQVCLVRRVLNLICK